MECREKKGQEILLYENVATGRPRCASCPPIRFQLQLGLGRVPLAQSPSRGIYLLARPS